MSVGYFQSLARACWASPAVQRMISLESQPLDRVRRIGRANVVVKIVQLDDHAADSCGGPRLREIGPASILSAVTKGKSFDAQDTLRCWQRESCP